MAVCLCVEVTGLCWCACVVDCVSVGGRVCQSGWVDVCVCVRVCYNLTILFLQVIG